MEIGRREFLTGLAAVAAVAVVPAVPVAAAPAASNIRHLFLRAEEEATRWQFRDVTSDPLSRYSVQDLMPSSLWDFDAHLDFKQEDRLFSIRHVTSGFTFRQVHARTTAVRFDYWDMSADKTSAWVDTTWVDTTDIAIIGEAAVCALAGILCLPTPTFKSPFRVRFSRAPFSCLEKPVVAELKTATRLDHYDHVED